MISKKSSPNIDEEKLILHKGLITCTSISLVQFDLPEQVMVALVFFALIAPVSNFLSNEIWIRLPLCFKEVFFIFPFFLVVLYSFLLFSSANGVLFFFCSF
ncbi:MAG: hypothetical protein D8M18_10110 [Bacteroidetes bacterium]|nr:hypothetical protein [Bacteroidota bacterium]